MVVKIYISGISGNKEVKKRQQRVLMILDSKNVEYEVIDITEPGKEDDKEFMQTNSKARDSKYPLPPQIFNDDDYCGDYENFDLANEIDELEQFLKTMGDDILNDDDDDDEKEKSQSQSNSHNKQNGNSASREVSTEKEVSNVVTENETDDRQHSTADEENDDEDKSKSLDDEDEDNDVKKSENKSDKKEKNTDKSKEQEE